MTYLDSMNVEEITNQQSPATIRVSWIFGDQHTDEVQGYVEPVNATALESLAPSAAVKVDPGGAQPTSVDVPGVPAPALWQVSVAPRVNDASGTLLENMPDGSGASPYWESFVLTRLVSLTGAAVGGGSGAPGAPKITGIDRSRGRFVVHWDSGTADHFDVRVGSATDQRGQDEIPGNWREYGVDFVEAGVYAFGIQGCNRHVLTGVSDCSAWTGTEIVVTPADDWRTQDVVIDLAAGFAVAAQDQAAPGQLDLVTVDQHGTVLLALDRQAWQGWLPLTGPGAAPPGAPVAMAAQPPNAQLDVFFVGPNGRVQVMWVAGHDRWNGPAPLHDVAVAPAGAELIAVHQPPNDQLDVLVVGNDGAVTALWEVDEHTWSVPLPLTAARFAPPGGCLAAAQQPANDQLDVFVVGNDGALQVLWVQGEGNWQGPVALGPAGLAAPGAFLDAHTLGQQARLDVVVPGVDRRLNVFTVQGAGNWQGPTPLGDPVLADRTRIVCLDTGEVYARAESRHFVRALVTGQPPVPVL
jgi:hypothetical protein